MSYLELLESELHAFQIQVTRQQLMTLEAYCTELDRWNQKMNLTALCGAHLVRRLVAEPVWIARQLPLGGSLLDIGSGNGSPALPFHVLRSFRTCHLVEGRAKRAAFLRHLAATLKLSGVVVHRSRFEDTDLAVLERPDWITLQAVSLKPRLADALQGVMKRTTTIVWITSGDSRVKTPTGKTLQLSRTLRVPFTATQVFLYQLDLP